MNTFISVNDHIKKWKEFEEGPPLCFLPNIRKIIRYYIKEKNTDNLLKINEYIKKFIYIKDDGSNYGYDCSVCVKRIIFSDKMKFYYNLISKNISI